MLSLRAESLLLNRNTNSAVQLTTLRAKTRNAISEGQSRIMNELSTMDYTDVDDNSTVVLDIRRQSTLSNIVPDPESEYHEPIEFESAPQDWLADWRTQYD